MKRGDLHFSTAEIERKEEDSPSTTAALVPSSATLHLHGGASAVPSQRTRPLDGSYSFLPSSSSADLHPRSGNNESAAAAISPFVGVTSYLVYLTYCSRWNAALDGAARTNGTGRKSETKPLASVRQQVGIDTSPSSGIPKVHHQPALQPEATRMLLAREDLEDDQTYQLLGESTDDETNQDRSKQGNAERSEFTPYTANVEVEIIDPSDDDSVEEESEATSTATVAATATDTTTGNEKVTEPQQQQKQRLPALWFSPRGPKTRRVVKTKEQTRVLEAAYRRDPLPDREALEDLETQLSLPYLTLQTWFQNRRAKQRRQEKKSKLTSEK
jgi:hypothetical protein